MNKNKVLSIIAYYLSEYDLKAVKALGYSNRAEAFREISKVFNNQNNYLKLRRDEFDALPDSSSKRNGWKNRKPAKDVVELAQELKQFNFDELTKMIKSLIDNANIKTKNNNINTENIADIDENEIEYIINFRDEKAYIKYENNKTNAVRVYNHNIISCLKKLYGGKCQLCGKSPLDGNNLDICEAHHIEYYSKSMNNDSCNIIIICPNHHRLIHKLNPEFDWHNLRYVFSDGSFLPIKYNLHLK